jgi:archaellum component FlaC
VEEKKKRGIAEEDLMSIEERVTNDLAIIKSKYEEELKYFCEYNVDQ